MDVQTPRVFCSKTIIQDQMFIDFVDVDNFARQFLRQQNQ